MCYINTTESSLQNSDIQITSPCKMVQTTSALSHIPQNLYETGNLYWGYEHGHDDVFKWYVLVIKVCTIYPHENTILHKEAPLSVCDMYLQD